MQNENISLYYKDARSDKEYHLQLVAEGDGFMIYYQNGKRGGTLTNKAKTTAPVDYAKAKKAYDAVVKQKISGGYVQGEAGTPYVGTPLEARATGVLCQLSNLITEEQAQLLIEDPAWAAQQKFDGERRLIRRIRDETIGINRKGFSVGLAMPILQASHNIVSTGSMIVDGEQMGDFLVIFDVLEYEGVNLRNEQYVDRLKVLGAIANQLGDPADTGIQVIYTARTTEEKRKLYEQMRANGEEGVVFKLLSSVYEEGRPNSGGNQLKRKFVHRASILVDSIHATKRSVGMALKDASGSNVFVGNCTIPSNHAIPNVGQVVEVEYLYAFLGGSLFQPQYLGVRNDINPEECLTRQLVYKAGSVQDSEEEDAENS